MICRTPYSSSVSKFVSNRRSGVWRPILSMSRKTAEIPANSPVLPNPVSRAFLVFVELGLRVQIPPPAIPSHGRRLICAGGSSSALFRRPVPSARMVREPRPSRRRADRRRHPCRSSAPAGGGRRNRRSCPEKDVILILLSPPRASDRYRGTVAKPPSGYSAACRNIGSL